MYSGTARPTEVVNLESISHQTVTVTCNGNLLETLTINKAYEEVHKGAVLLHQGETYISEELDLNQLTAKVRKENVNYYTEALKTVDVAIKKAFEEKNNGVKVGLGELLTTENYHTYVAKSYDEVIKRQPIMPAVHCPFQPSVYGLLFLTNSDKKLKNKGSILTVGSMLLNTQ